MSNNEDRTETTGDGNPKRPALLGRQLLGYALSRPTPVERVPVYTPTDKAEVGEATGKTYGVRHTESLGTEIPSTPRPEVTQPAEGPAGRVDESSEPMGLGFNPKGMVSSTSSKDAKDLLSDADWETITKSPRQGILPYPDVESTPAIPGNPAEVTAVQSKRDQAVRDYVATRHAQARGEIGVGKQFTSPAADEGTSSPVSIASGTPFRSQVFPPNVKLPAQLEGQTVASDPEGTSLVTSLINRVADIHRSVGGAKEHADVDAAHVKAYEEATTGAKPTISRQLFDTITRTGLGSLPTRERGFRQGTGANDTSYNAHILDKLKSVNAVTRKAHAGVSKKWEQAVPYAEDTADTAVAGDERWTSVTRDEAHRRIKDARGAVMQALSDGHISEDVAKSHFAKLDEIHTTLLGDGSEPTSLNPSGRMPKFRDEHEGQMVIPGMETKQSPATTKATRKPSSDTGWVSGQVFGSSGPEGKEASFTDESGQSYIDTTDPLTGTTIRRKVTSVDEAIGSDEEARAVPLRSNIAEIARGLGRTDFSVQRASRARAMGRREKENAKSGVDNGVMTETQEAVQGTLEEKEAARVRNKAARQSNLDIAGQRTQSRTLGAFGGVIHVHKVGNSYHTAARFHGTDTPTRWLRDRADSPGTDLSQRAKEMTEGIDPLTESRMETEAQGAMNSKAYSVNKEGQFEDAYGSLGEFVGRAGASRDYALTVVHHDLGSSVVDSLTGDILGFAPKMDSGIEMNMEGLSKVRAATNTALSASMPKVSMETPEDVEDTMHSVGSNKAQIQDYIDKNFANSPHHIKGFSIPDLKEAVLDLGRRQKIDKAAMSDIESMTPLDLTSALVGHARQATTATREAEAIGEGRKVPMGPLEERTEENPDIPTLAHPHAYGWDPSRPGKITGKKVVVGPEALAPEEGITGAFTRSGVRPEGERQGGIPIDIPSAHLLDHVIRHMSRTQQSRAEKRSSSGVVDASSLVDDAGSEIVSEPGTIMGKREVRTVSEPVPGSTEGETREVEKELNIPVSPEEKSFYDKAVAGNENALNRRRKPNPTTSGIVHEVVTSADAARSSLSAALGRSPRKRGMPLAPVAAETEETSEETPVAEPAPTKKKRNPSKKKTKPAVEATEEPNA